MNLQEIIDDCRDQARDNGALDVDRLWPDAEMVRYANKVQNRIARETLCIKDSTTPDICILALTPVDYTTYVAGTLDYIWANDSDHPLYQLDVTPYIVPLHDRILEIEEVKLMSGLYRLGKASVKWWQHYIQWEATLSTPTEFATDLQVGSIALFGRMETADTLQLAVSRMPLAPFVVADMDEQTPDIRVSYHDFFHNGILGYMYSKQDAETLDKAKAVDYNEQFDDDIDEIKRQENIVLNDSVSVNRPLKGNM